jgi:anaerobic selenocysteine-containing dehydrogenase
VTVKQGEAVALRGDPHHPYTRGSLCNKVADYVNYTRASDRVLYPMRRVGPKGNGQFTRISWEEAIETVATRLRDVIASHGGEAIWPYVGSGNMGLIQGIYGAGRRLWNVLGASGHAVTICTIAGGFGTGYTLGDNRVGMDPETFRLSKLIVLWGANVLSTHPHLWRPILEARKHGAFVVPDCPGKLFQSLDYRRSIDDGSPAFPHDWSGGLGSRPACPAPPPRRERPARRARGFPSSDR